MEELTENSGAPLEEILTPTHSIPPGIHSLSISGSKGRFFNSKELVPSTRVTGFDKSISNPCNFDPKQYRFDQLYLDAAKRAAAKDQLSTYANIKKEQEVECFKTDKRLSKAESLELFDRLNKEAEARNERLKISKRIKEAQEIKDIKQPKINKSTINLKEDVVTRLLQYGENTKKKNEDRARLKKEKEDEEIKNMPSVHKKILSEPNSFSVSSTPIRNYNSRASPEKSTQLSHKSTYSLQQSPNSALVKGTIARSSNSPEKIIQKIKNLIRITSTKNPKELTPRPIKGKIRSFIIEYQFVYNLIISYKLIVELSLKDFNGCVRSAVIGKFVVIMFLMTRLCFLHNSSIFPLVCRPRF